MTPRSPSPFMERGWGEEISDRQEIQHYKT